MSRGQRGVANLAVAAAELARTLNLDPSVIKQFPKNRPDIMPA